MICLQNINQLNDTFGTRFASQEQIDPPRPQPRQTDHNNKWWQEWTKFRQHQVFLQNWQKMKWLEEIGIPTNMIYGHQGTESNHAVWPTDYQPASALSANTIASTGLPPYGSGQAAYGTNAQNSDNQFFQKIKNVNPNWVIPETNPVSLSDQLPTDYNSAYQTLQQAFLHGARVISPIAWHVNYFDGSAKTLGPVKVRQTAYEDAIRDFVQLYGQYPREDMVWEFGKISDECRDKTGVTKCQPNDRIDHTNLEGWSLNNLTLQSLKNSVVKAKLLNNDPNFLSPDNLSFSASKTNTIKLKVKFQQTDGPVIGECFWTTDEDHNFDQKKRQWFGIEADGQWHTYTIPIGNHLEWKGKIKQIRFDPGTELALNGKIVEIDFIWIQDNPENN